MQCGLQDSADLTVFNLLDNMMFFLTVPHWAVYTLVLLLHVCTLILIDIDIDIISWAIKLASLLFVTEV